MEFSQTYPIYDSFAAKGIASPSPYGSSSTNNSATPFGSGFGQPQQPQQPNPGTGLNPMFSNQPPASQPIFGSSFGQPPSQPGMGMGQPPTQPSTMGQQPGMGMGGGFGGGAGGGYGSPTMGSMMGQPPMQSQMGNPYQNNAFGVQNAGQMDAMRLKQECTQKMGNEISMVGTRLGQEINNQRSSLQTISKKRMELETSLSAFTTTLVRNGGSFWVCEHVCRRKLSNRLENWRGRMMRMGE